MKFLRAFFVVQYTLLFAAWPHLIEWLARWASEGSKGCATLTLLFCFLYIPMLSIVFMGMSMLIEELSDE